MDEEKNNIAEISSILDNILSKTNLSKVTSTGIGFEDVEDGYYLVAAKKYSIKVADETTKIPGTIIVTLSFAIVEDGLKLEDDSYTTIKGVKNRYINKTYFLKDDEEHGNRDMKLFASDLKKFEVPGEKGVSIFTEEYFENSKNLIEALELLVENNLRIYLSVQTKQKQPGQISDSKKNVFLISWSTIEKLALDYGFEVE